MDALQSPNSLLFLGVSFVALLATARQLVRSFRSSAKESEMVSLGDAAAAAYESAQQKRMVIASVADRAGAIKDAIAWFARSIAGVVPVYRRSGNGRFEKAGGSSEPTALHIRKRDLKAYLRWARSVQ
jgi:hypothetical protein